VSFIKKVSAIVGAADSFAVLMWASFIGSIVAIILAISQRLLTLHQSLDAWVSGIRSMMMAAVILTAAWAIGNICRDLFTADYVVHLTKTFLSAHWLPLLIFLSAGVIAFATGTSWGTMAILMPIAIPLAYKFPQQDPTIVGTHETSILLSTIAAVLAGATFGDHCSPISDTTIMSSMASSADHIDHVRTQLPYAVTAATIACAFGYIPVGFGVSNWIVLPVGMAVTFLIVRFVGKKVE
jgi:Na+/H+ antiporter NhaC